MLFEVLTRLAVFTESTAVTAELHGAKQTGTSFRAYIRSVTMDTLHQRCNGGIVSYGAIVNSFSELCCCCVGIVSYGAIVNSFSELCCCNYGI